MKRIKTMLFVLIAIGMFTACDIIGEGEEYGTWLTDATDWEDDDGNRLSFVETEENSGAYYLDLTYAITDGETVDTIMAFISDEDYTVSGTTLIGRYHGDDPEVTFDITIEFTYANGILTADINVDESEGFLVDRLLQLSPAE